MLRSVSAGGSDALAGADRIPVQLRNAVDEAVEQLGRLVRLAIPMLIFGRILEPEVGAEIHERDAARDDVRGERLARAMRQGGEDEVDAVQHARLETLDPNVGIGQREMRMDVGQTLSSLTVAEQPSGAKRGMRRAQAQQLYADETRSTE